MFAVTPYSAEAFSVETNQDGTRMIWRPCRVIGATKNEDGDLSYVVEVFDNGESFLDTADVVRKYPDD